MDADRTRTIRAISFAIMVVVLLLIAAGCAGTLILASRSAGLAAPGSPVRRAFAKIALLSTATLGLTLVLLVWAVARWVSDRFDSTRPQPRAPTPYVDAWSEAGQRFKLEDNGENEQDEGEAEEPG